MPQKAETFRCPVFCLLLRVSSDYAQPITGPVTEVTCPVIGQAQPELTHDVIMHCYCCRWEFMTEDYDIGFAVTFSESGSKKAKEVMANRRVDCYMIPEEGDLVCEEPGTCKSWWRHQIEAFSALLALCVGNSPVTGEFPSQRPVTRSFDVSFDLHLNKRLSKQSWGWWFETPSCPLWPHCNGGDFNWIKGRGHLTEPSFR